jgi:nucleoside-diphosphate-sugar epimerase
LPAERALLLTGATGFVGGEVLLRVLERTDREVVLPVRGDAPARVGDVLRRLGAARHAGRVHAIPAEAPWPLRDDIDVVVHAAASVRFDLPLEQARAANVEGTRAVLDQSRRCPNLERVVHVSTAYVAGPARNTYEQSKDEAEGVVRASGLPWQVVRPSIVVGDSRTGWTTSFNVIYVPLRAFSRGLLRAIPGDPSAVVDVVPVDHVADGLLALLDEPVGGTHQVVAGPRAGTVGELAVHAARTLGRPVPPPAAAIPDLGLSELEPYFDVRDRFHDPATDTALAARGLVAPPLASYLQRLLAFAWATRWGKAMPPRRPASILPVAG